MKARILAVALALLTALAAVACTATLHLSSSPAAPPRPAPRYTAAASHGPAAGIVTSDLAAFDAACGCTPGLAVRYVRWGETEQAANLAYDLQHGAVPLAELQPYGVTLAQVAGGSQDAYLAAFARQVAALHAPVLMSFGPEVNNDSYPWGYRHAGPAGFVAAWRHVVTVFRQAGATDVKWVLVVNYSSTHTESLASLWPGPGYVDMVGLDGYAISAATTFSGLFGATIAEVRQLGNVPVMVTETGANPAAGQARWMSQVTAGVAAYGLTGFVWFDVDQKGAAGGNDWSIDADPAALAAFRAAVKEYGQ